MSADNLVLFVERLTALNMSTIQEVGNSSTLEDSQSEFSDSSFLDIDLDEVEHEEIIDITESIELQVNEDQEEVSSMWLW